MSNTFDVDAVPLFDQHGCVIRRVQTIPDEFTRRLADERFESWRPAGEMHRAASIPNAVVEKWLREGYDVFQEPISKSLKKLRDEGLDAFITTNKRL